MISTTSYNVIDSFRHFCGQEKWDRIAAEVKDFQNCALTKERNTVAKIQNFSVFKRRFPELGVLPYCTLCLLLDCYDEQMRSKEVNGFVYGFAKIGG